MGNYDDYSTSFSEYLSNYNDLNNGMHKFVILLSENQYAIEIDRDVTHDGMVKDLLSKTRPSMKIDSFGVAHDPNDTYVNDLFFLLGYKDYMHIELMNIKVLSQEQYDCLSEILYYIKDYNEKYNNKFKVTIAGNVQNGISFDYYETKIPEVLEKIKKCVGPVIPPQETIIGKKILNDKEVTKEDIDFLVEKMANSEVDTNDFSFVGNIKHTN